MAQRNLKEQGGMLQLQEQAAAQDQLASLALAQQQESLQQVMQPGGVSAQAASTRFAEDVKREEEQRKKYGREVGAAVGAVGTVAGGIVGGIYGGPAGAAAGAAGGGALGSAVGQGAGEAMSDKRLKKHVETAKSDVKKFLDSVGAKKYEYKDPKAPGAAKGERVGVMAQDLEKSEMGKALVRNTPQGKMVDTVQGFGALLAAQAEMHNRLKKLEKGKK
jgi:uncharacterized protein YcfJ